MEVFHCSNCLKPTEVGGNDIYYTIRDNFGKYRNKCWCSNCLKAVQKICEEKWGVNKDCLFGEYDGEVYKHDPKTKPIYTCGDNICPWCELITDNIVNKLDHYYHFHGKDKGKCDKNYHKTEEIIKQWENSGEKGCEDVRKLYYIEDNNNNDDDRERERERAKLRNWESELRS